METVTEAKYAYWRTVIGIASVSGMAKEEWCRKNCISIKTFNHYLGVFRRQEARKARNGLEPNDGSTIKEEAIGQGNADMALDQDDQEKEATIETGIEEGEDDDKVLKDERREEVEGSETRFFEIPMTASKCEADSKQEIKNEAIDQACDGKDDEPDSSQGMVIEIGDVKLHIGSGVTEETLRTVLKAVGCHA